MGASGEPGDEGSDAGTTGAGRASTTPDPPEDDAWAAPGAPSDPSPPPRSPADLSASSPPSPSSAIRPPARSTLRSSGPVHDDRHSGTVALPAPLRPLTIGDIIDGAFQVLKRAPGVVIGVSAIFVVPVQVLAAWMQRDSVSDLDAFFGDASTQLQGSSTVDGTEFGLTVLLLALGSIAPAFVGACLARLVTAWYAGRDLTTSEVFRGLKPVWPSLVGAFLISHLLTGVGLMVCLVPGAVLMVFFVVTMPVVAVEQLGPIAALQRSVALVSKRFWPATGVVALSIAGSFVLETSLSFIPTVVAFVVPDSVAWVVLALGSSLAAVIVTPVVAAATVLLYLDLRFRVEGLDLQLRSADVLGVPSR